MANLKKDVLDWLAKYGTNMADVKVRYKNEADGEDSEVVIEHGKAGRWFAFDRAGFESYANGGLKAFKSCAKSDNIEYVLPVKYRKYARYANHKSYIVENVSGVNNATPQFKVWDKVNKNYVVHQVNVRGNKYKDEDLVWNNYAAASASIDEVIDAVRQSYMTLKKEDVENEFGQPHPVFKVVFDEMFVGYIFPLKYFGGKNKPSFVKKEDEWGWTSDTLLMSKVAKFGNMQASFKTREDAERYAYEFAVDKFGEPEGEKSVERLEIAEEAPVVQSSLNQETDLKGKQKQYAFQFGKTEFINRMKKAIEDKKYYVDAVTQKDKLGRYSATLRSKATDKVAGTAWVVPESKGDVLGKKEITERAIPLICTEMHFDSVALAIEKEQFEEAISEGLMTANDAASIIADAGIVIPSEIIDLVRAKNEKPSETNDDNKLGNKKFQCELFVTRKKKGTGNEGQFADSDEAVQSIVFKGLLIDDNVESYTIRIYDGTATGITWGREEIAKRITEMKAEEEQEAGLSIESALKEVNELLSGTRTKLSTADEPAKIPAGRLQEKLKGIADLLNRFSLIMARVGANDYKYGQTLRDGQYMPYVNFKASGKNYKKGLRIHVLLDEGRDEYIVEGIVMLGVNVKNVGTQIGIQAASVGDAIWDITDGEKIVATDLTDPETKNTAKDFKQTAKLFDAITTNFAQSVRYRDTDLKGKPLVDWMLILKNNTSPNFTHYEQQVTKAFASGQIYDAIIKGAIMPKDAVSILEAAGIPVPNEYTVAAAFQQKLIDKQAQKMLQYLEALSASVEPLVASDYASKETEMLEFKSIIIQPADKTIYDLLGDRKKDWMHSREQLLKVAPKEVFVAGSKYVFKKGKLRNGNTFYESKDDTMFAYEMPSYVIQQAANGGEFSDYVKAINEGRMTAFDAIYIMQSAGVEVPAEILALAGITENTPTIIGKVLDLKGDTKAGWMLSKEERIIAYKAIQAEVNIPDDADELEPDEWNKKVRELDTKSEGYTASAVRDALEKNEIVDAVMNGKLTALDAVKLIQADALAAQAVFRERYKVPTTLFEMAYEETVRGSQIAIRDAEKQSVKEQFGEFAMLMGDRLNQPKELWMLTFSQFNERLEESINEIVNGKYYSPAFRTPTQVKSGGRSVGLPFPQSLEGNSGLMREWVYKNNIGHALGKDLQSVLEIGGEAIFKYPFNADLYVTAIEDQRMTVEDVEEILIGAGFVVPESVNVAGKKMEKNRGSIIGSKIDLLGDFRTPLMMTEDEYYTYEKERLLEVVESYVPKSEVRKTLDRIPKFRYRFIDSSELSVNYTDKKHAEDEAAKYKREQLELVNSGKNINGKVDIKEGWRKAVGMALDTQYYQRNIEQGRMSAKDAEIIIDSAGYPVPNDILEMTKQSGKVKSVPVQPSKATQEKQTEALAILCQPFLNEWAEAFGLYGAFTDEGFEIRMQRVDKPLLKYTSATDEVRYAGQLISDKNFIVELVTKVVFQSLSAKFQKSLIEFYTSIWNWEQENKGIVTSERQPIASDGAIKFTQADYDRLMEGNKFYADTYKGKNFTIEHYIYARPKLKYNTKAKALGIWSDSAAEELMLMGRVKNELADWLSENGYLPTASKKTERYSLEEKKNGVIRASQFFVTIWGSSEMQAKSEMTGNIFRVTVRPRDTRQITNVLWYNIGSGLLILGKNTQNDLSGVEIIKAVESTFGQYDKAFKKALLAYYDNVVQYFPEKRTATILQTPKSYKDYDLGQMFDDAFVRGDGEISALDIVAFVDKLNENERTAFYTMWRIYREKNNVTLSDTGYYTNPKIANQEQDDIQTGTISAAPEVKYIRALFAKNGLLESSSGQGYAVKYSADNKDEYADWRYYPRAHDTSDAVRSHFNKGGKGKVKVFWFNVVTDILTSKLFGENIDKDDVAELVVTPKDVTVSDEGLLLTPNKYDLRVGLGSDYVTMFRNFFIKANGKVEKEKMMNYINGLDAKMNSAYLTAFAEYKGIAQIEERGGYYINPILFEKEDEIEEAATINAVVQPPTEDQKTIVQKTARTNKYGFVLKMNAEDSDADAAWEFAASPLVVVRTMAAHDAESALVFYFDKTKGIMVNAIIQADWEEEVIAEKLDSMMDEPAAPEEVIAEKEIAQTSKVLSAAETKKVEESIKTQKNVDMSLLKKYKSFPDLIGDNKSPFHLMNKSQKMQAEAYYSKQLAEAEEFEDGGGIDYVDSKKNDIVQEFEVGGEIYDSRNFWRKRTIREDARPLASMNIVGDERWGRTLTYRYNHGDFTEDMARKMLSKLCTLNADEVTLEQVAPRVILFKHNGQQIGLVNGNDFELSEKYVNHDALKAGFTFAKLFPELNEAWEAKYPDVVAPKKMDTPKFEDGGAISDDDTFNIVVKYNVGQADIDTKGILMLELQKTNMGTGYGRVPSMDYLYATRKKQEDADYRGDYESRQLSSVRLRSYVRGVKPTGLIILTLVDSTYGSETYEVRYNVDKEDYHKEDDAESVFNYVKKRIEMITYCTYRTWDDIDTVKEVKVDILSVELADKMADGGAVNAGGYVGKNAGMLKEIEAVIKSVLTKYGVEKINGKYLSEKDKRRGHFNSAQAATDKRAVITCEENTSGKDMLGGDTKSEAKLFILWDVSMNRSFVSEFVAFIGKDKFNKYFNFDSDGWIEFKIAIHEIAQREANWKKVMSADFITNRNIHLDIPETKLFIQNIKRLIDDMEVKDWKPSDADLVQGLNNVKSFEQGGVVGIIYEALEHGGAVAAEAKRNIWVRFNLSNDANYMKWKIENKVTGEVVYLEPSEVQIVMNGCKVTNSPATAMKIFQGKMTKAPIAYVKCESADISYDPLKYKVDEKNWLRYNPRETPNWVDTEGNNIDNHTFPRLITLNRRVYIYDENKKLQHLARFEFGGEVAGEFELGGSIIAKGKEGECYKNVQDYLLENDLPAAMIVHGEITSREGNRIKHAWIEDGERVIDPTTGVIANKEDYYARLKPTADDVYTFEEAMKLRFKTKNFGAWTDAELLKVLGRQKMSKLQEGGGVELENAAR